MTGTVKHLQDTLLSADLLNRLAAREAKCDKSGGHPVAELEQTHLTEAIGWLIRAMDTMPYGGISRGYSFGWNPYFPKRGWQPAHPRATGEAISTLFDCAAILSQDNLRSRAVALANWLIKIQMFSGAIRGGALDEPPSSEGLNTAAAVLGWTRAYQETGTERFAQAARRACDFLLVTQKPQASCKPNEPGSHRNDYAAHGSRVGLALVQAGIAMEEYRYCAAGELSVGYSLRCQKPNGWFRGSCLDDVQHPLLHNIASDIDGTLQTAIILEEDNYLRAAKKAADALLDKVSTDGRMSGRFAVDWSSAASWSCLAGEALMISSWLRLRQMTGADKYLIASRRVIDLIKRSQNHLTSNPGLRGGIKGSFPCDGEFGRHQILSSATTHFIDAFLLLRQSVSTQFSSSSRADALG